MDMKRDYAFVVCPALISVIFLIIYYFHIFFSFVFLFLLIQEFSDYRDADDARHSLNGRDFDGSRIIVEFSRGVSYLLHFLD